MVIFIDFDDVLFNTKKFKQDLEFLFFENGISKEIFDKYYQNPNSKIKTYDPWKQLKGIADHENINVENIKKELEYFMIDTTAYLFEDSVLFLDMFKQNFICIVSYGESYFQEMKIGECGVGMLCEKIQITDQLKSGVIEKIIRDKRMEKKKIFFLDDRAEQIEDVKKRFPQITTIFMRRSEGRYHDERNAFCDFTAIDLKEAAKIIKSF